MTNNLPRACYGSTYDKHNVEARAAYDDDKGRAVVELSFCSPFSDVVVSLTPAAALALRNLIDASYRDARKVEPDPYYFARLIDAADEATS